jgi:hypothetical protein
VGNELFPNIISASICLFSLLPQFANSIKLRMNQLSERNTEIYQYNHSPELARLPAVEMLRKVWIRYFFQDDSKVCLRNKPNQSPAARLIKH